LSIRDDFDKSPELWKDPALFGVKLVAMQTAGFYPLGSKVSQKLSLNSV
jgi:hypothetical protein